MIKLNSLDRKFGYNMRQDSEGGMIPAEETRKRLSEAGKKRFEDKVLERISKDPKEREKFGKRFKEF